MKYVNNPQTGKPDKVASSITDIDDLEALLVDTKDPTGFVDPDNITVAYDSTARTITLTHSSGSIEYYWRGIKHDIASPWTSSAHTNVNDKYFLSSTDGTNFTWSTTVWTFDQIQVAIANYGTSDKFGLSESHGLMPWTVHQELHDLLGTYRVSGGAPTAGTYTENTASDAATTPGFDAAVIKDEDVSHSISTWSQGTYTTLRIGASSVATFDTAASFPFRSSGSYILINNPATGAETASATNRYVNVYQIMIPVTGDVTSQLYRMVMLQPQADYASLASAQAEDPRGLSLGSLSTTAPEIVFFTRITYVLSAGDANTGKCRIATGGITYITGTRQSQVSTGGFTPGPSAGASYIVQTADASLPNAQAMGALATGIVKNTTTTGVQSIAVAGDFPTLNQNTTGSAATLTTARTIDGVSFNGSANIQTAISAKSDYSQTTWTPTMTIGGSNTGITYAYQEGAYIQLGRFVFGSCILILSSTGGLTGDVQIAGLPFGALIGNGSITAQYYSGLAGITTLAGRINAGTSTIILGVHAATSLDNLTHANLTNNARIDLSFTYYK